MDELTPVCSRRSLVLLFLWAMVFCDRVCSLRLNPLLTHLPQLKQASDRLGGTLWWEQGH